MPELPVFCRYGTQLYLSSVLTDTINQLGEWQRPAEMVTVTQKTEIEPIDGTPFKRMFWSIISDYDLKTGLCELVDNAVDFWAITNRSRPLRISLDLDVDRQLISATDNAGGVKREELHLLVAPGGSRNDPSAEMIGVFGVGSKRAAIALAENVVIKTRFRDEETSELDITPDWVESEGWQLPAYAIPDIEEGTTQVHMSHLRAPLNQINLDELAIHLGETYDWFLREGCVIELNGTPVTPRNFEAWAFPPGFPPRSTTFDADIKRTGRLKVTITAGLIRDRIPEADNYGVYFYCNHRLIAKEVKTRDVGYFIGTEAGVPHTDASLCRVIVRIQGPAHLMPWNSSKSGIVFGHVAYQQMRPPLITLVSHFSSLSRRLRDDWQKNVFRHDTGQIENIEAGEVLTGRRLILPALPRANKTRAERYKAINKVQLEGKPWTLGLVEAMAAVEIIGRQNLQTKNRMALILLDSNFEIALKEFIVHREDLFPKARYNDAAIQNLFSKRDRVIQAVTQEVSIPKNLIDAANHYYNLRNKLIHERATVGVTDSDVNSYRLTIERLLSMLFDLKFSD